MTATNIQLGKNGITENFITSLKNQFKTKGSIRISVLKNARGDGKEGKEEVKKYSKEILEKLGKQYTAKIIGFVIILKKWRKARDEKEKAR